jgi:polyphosphate kinase
VDQYLEHSRIYLFCNNGDEKLFISSADLMQRNLDRRVEVTCPIYDAGIRKELLTFLDIQWRDNVKACMLDASMTNCPKTGQGDEMIRAQTHIMQYLTRLHGQTDPKELPR